MVVDVNTGAKIAIVTFSKAIADRYRHRLPTHIYNAIAEPENAEGRESSERLLRQIVFACDAAGMSEEIIRSVCLPIPASMALNGIDMGKIADFVLGTLQQKMIN